VHSLIPFIQLNTQGKKEKGGGGKSRSSITKKNRKKGEADPAGCNGDINRPLRSQKCFSQIQERKRREQRSFNSPFLGEKRKKSSTVLQKAPSELTIGSREKEGGKGGIDSLYST